MDKKGYVSLSSARETKTGIEVGLRRTSGVEKVNIMDFFCLSVIS